MRKWSLKSTLFSIIAELIRKHFLLSKLYSFRNLLSRRALSISQYDLKETAKLIIKLKETAKNLQSVQSRKIFIYNNHSSDLLVSTRFKFLVHIILKVNKDWAIQKHIFVKIIVKIIDYFTRIRTWTLYSISQWYCFVQHAWALKVYLMCTAIFWDMIFSIIRVDSKKEICRNKLWL